MKTSALSVLALVAGALANFDLPAGVPRSVEEFRRKHVRPQWDDPPGRKLITLRPSANDTDDVSELFFKALQDANDGGTVFLAPGETYIIGKPLDLTFLNNVHVRLDGEIKFTNDTPYWQAKAFRHPFQNSIMFWKWGGKNVRIFGDGVINGNGQRWWNEFSGLEILDPSNAYLRPILFYAENATGLDIQGIHLKDSPCWTTFFVTCKRSRRVRGKDHAYRCCKYKQQRTSH